MLYQFVKENVNLLIVILIGNLLTEVWSVPTSRVDKVLFVGHVFEHRLQDETQSGCRIKTFKVQDFLSDDANLPAWLHYNDSSTTLYGFPDKPGHYRFNIILFGAVFGNFVHLCQSVFFEIIVKESMSSLQHILPILSDSTSDYKYCLDKEIHILTIMVVPNGDPSNHNLLEQGRRLSVELNLPLHSLQIAPSNSSAVFYKQLHSLNIVLSSISDQQETGNEFVFSWPVPCDGVTNLKTLSTLLEHKRKRRSLLSSAAATHIQWHVTRGYIRIRRDIFFGSISAIVGTPIETTSPTVLLPSSVKVMSTHTAVISITSSSMITSIRNDSAISSYLLPIISTISLSFSNVSIFSLSRGTSSIPSQVRPILSTISTRQFSSTFELKYSSETEVSSAPSQTINTTTTNAIQLTPALMSSTLVSNSSLQSSNIVSSPLALSSNIVSSPSALSSNIVSSPLALSSNIVSSPSSLSSNIVPSPSALSSNIVSSPLALSSNIVSSPSALSSNIVPASSVQSSSVVSMHSPNSTFLQGSSIIPTSTLHVPTILLSPSSLNSTPLSTRHFVLNISSVLSTANSSTVYKTSTFMSLSLTNSTQSKIASTRVVSSFNETISATLSNETATKPISSIVSTSEASNNKTIPMTSTALSTRMTVRNQSHTTEISMLSSQQPTNLTSSFNSNTSIVSTRMFSSEVNVSSNITTAFSSIISSSDQLVLNLTEIKSPLTPSTVQMTKLMNLSSSSSASQTTLTTFTVTRIPPNSTITVSSTPSITIQSRISHTKVQSVTNLPSSIRTSPDYTTLAASSTSILPSKTYHQNKSSIDDHPTLSTSTLLSSTYKNQPSSSKYATKSSDVTSTIAPSSNTITTNINSPTTSFPTSFTALESPFSIASTSEASTVTTQLESTFIVDSSSVQTPSHTSRIPTATAQLESTIIVVDPSSDSAEIESTHAPIATIPQLESTVVIVDSSSKSESTKSTPIKPTISHLESTATESTSMASTHILILPSASSSILPSSTTTITTTPDPNTPPVVTSLINTLFFGTGKLTSFQIPYDVFQDKEDGGTRNLSLTCSSAEDGSLDITWLTFNSTTQTLYAFPLESDYTNQSNQALIVHLTARDSGGLFSMTQFKVVVTAPINEISYYVSMTLLVDYNEFLRDKQKRFDLISRLNNYYTEQSNSLYIHTVKQGSTVVTFNNLTLATQPDCDKQAILQNTALTKKPNTNEPQEAFANHMSPEFPVVDMQLVYQKQCVVASTQAPVSASENDYLDYVIPIIVLTVILIIVIIIVIVLTRRQRRKQTYFAGSRKYEKGEPSLFPDEVELRINASIKPKREEETVQGAYAGPYDLEDDSLDGPIFHARPAASKAASVSSDDDSSYYSYFRTPDGPPPAYMEPPPYRSPYYNHTSEI